MRESSRRIASLSSARHVGRESMVTSITLDSRKAAAGSLFIPLCGQRVDGHDFINQALKQGCVALLLDESHYVNLCKYLPCDISVLVARDSQAALSRLASVLPLSISPGMTGIAVTGSCGKTTTKEMCASILSVSHKVSKTPGNLNSTLGLPLSLLSMEEGSEYGVFEFGVDHVGEMDELTTMLPPDLAIITNIGISHLANFGTRERLALEKSKILLPQTTGYVLADNPYIDMMRSRGARLEVVSNPFHDISRRGLEGVVLTLGRERFLLPLLGDGALKDASLAVALSRTLGISDAEIAEGLSRMQPLFGRGRVLHSGGLTIIEDCYNASLDSVSGAIDTLSHLSWRGAKHVVLGDMRELGPASKAAHRRVGEVLSHTSFEHIWLYGEEMEEAYRVLHDHGLAGRAMHTDDFDELSWAVHHTASSGDILLLKGSRALAMERLYEGLGEAV